MAIEPIRAGHTKDSVKAKLTEVMTRRLIQGPISVWKEIEDILNVSTPPEYQIKQFDSGASVISKTERYHFKDTALRSRRPTNLFQNGERGGWFAFRQPEHIFQSPGVIAGPGGQIVSVRNMINFGGNEEVTFEIIPNRTPSTFQWWNDRVGYITDTGDNYRINASSIGSGTYYVYACSVSGQIVRSTQNGSIWNVPDNQYTHYLFIDRELNEFQLGWLTEMMQQESWVLATGIWNSQSFWNPVGIWQ